MASSSANTDAWKHKDVIAMLDGVVVATSKLKEGQTKKAKLAEAVEAVRDKLTVLDIAEPHGLTLVSRLTAAFFYLTESAACWCICQ